MSEPSVEERSLPFGQAAAEYDTYHPSYPRVAAEWLLEGATRTVVDIADVGAGTGVFTNVLVDFGLNVTAFEPDSGMIDQFAHRLSSVTRGQTRAENLRVPDGSFDALTVAQAFHWFDAPVAAREFERVVRPGGFFGLLWNQRDDRVAWIAAMRRIAAGGDVRRGNANEATDEVASFFPSVERAEFAHLVPMTPQAIVGLVAPFSFVRLSPDRDQRLEAMREPLATPRPQGPRSHRRAVPNCRLPGKATSTGNI
ncbi:MAG: class I SAM-dependent methyltransferase [Acidimicrobiales bacterium]